MTTKKASAELLEQPKNPPQNPTLYYVGIGASAGGLEALRPFVGNLPELANMTYIVAQHMSPDHRSLMVELLQRETKLKVEPAQNNLSPLANTIYVAPANTDVTINKGKLRLTQPSNTIGPKPSVDRFFMSLAEDREDKCIAIVLSGTGSDGAHGIKAIKAAGGITIAQDPRSAKYDSMPHAAIRTGGADLVLPPSEIALQLRSIISRPRASLTEDQDELPPSTIRGIIHQIATHTGMDFTNYKDATLSRQIMRRMTAKQIANIEDYGKFLNKNEPELRELANNFLICVTSFFRDPEAFDVLRRNLKALLEKKQPGDDIRIWLPGCATGEEVYSVAILLMENLGERISQYRVQLFATDINSDAVHTARSGVYPEAALAEVNDNLIKKYFSVQNGMYQVDKRLKDMILFARQDLTQDPPFVRLDMVCCRNLLIYFKPELQDKVMKIFHYSLRDNGILFLGKSETVGKSSGLFSETDRKNKLYQKRNTATPIIGSFGRGSNSLGIFELRSVTAGKPALPAATLHSNGIEQLFNLYAPPSVLITQAGEILEIFGDCSGFLSIRKGKADFNLYNLIIPTLRAELRAFVHRVAKKRTSTYSAPTKLNIAGKEGLYRIATHYAGDQDKEDSDLLLISFEELKATEPKSVDEAALNEQAFGRVSELEQELVLNRENLQTVIEELETANEELQSLNEEAQAANEELQASNEELETSNEELQASNEELITVNDELNGRTLELAKTNTDLNNVIASLHQGLVVVDTHLMITRYNEIALQFFSIPSGLPANLATVTTQFEMPSLLKYVQQVLKFKKIVEYELQNKYQQYFLIRLSPYIEKQNTHATVTGVVLTIMDITEKKDGEEKLRLSASVFEHSSEATMITDADNNIIAINPAFTSITGYSAQEVIGQNPRILSSGRQSEAFYEHMRESLATQGVWQGEIQNKRKNGEIYTEYLSINVLKDKQGVINRHIAVFSDISEAKKALEIIERQANFDDLTQLPKRNLIRDRMEQLLIHNRRDGRQFAVMFLDLDDFKAINDSLGHDAGDELLIKVSKRIQAALRESDVVGRLGGDEFIILLNENINADSIITVANKILASVHRPIAIAGHTVQTGASIGITAYPSDGDSTDTLMKNADSAMYAAKHRGRNTFCFFTQSMQDEANKRQWMTSELSSALHRRQMQVYYQPVIDLTSMQVVGAEALLRWNHPQKGLILPDQFIAVAEQTGLIGSFSEWIIDTCLEDAQALMQTFERKYHLAINISMAEFLSKAHMEWLFEKLEANALVREQLVTLELTESIKLIDNDEYAVALAQIKASGCKIALDDFGTGQSSLNYIKRVPVDIIKIDKSFVRDIAVDPSDAAMVRAILKLAKAFNLSTIAEGVESQEQLAFLKLNGCESAQGFLFSEALPYQQFIEFLQAQGH
jgi:two-component system CheB/CheR fusion protein